MARDSTTETHAPRIFFTGASGDIRAEGGVRSTDFSPNGNTVQLAQVPANITSDTMQGNSKTGRAIYTGHARLWQGDSVLEADSIELLRETKILNAAGRVRAVFPRHPHRRNRHSAIRHATIRGGVANPHPRRKHVLWHVTSERSPTTMSPASPISKRTSSFSRPIKKSAHPSWICTSRAAPTVRQAAQPAVQGAPSTPGAQQISRAIGTGGVIVDQAGRRATADRGEYTAADGKFVMSGGNPTLYDGSEGTTTGHQLTFYLADDTIIVDSENGSRTLTKHRVEK